MMMEQFTPPLKKVSGDGKRGPENVCCVNLHSREWEVSSQTGAWDETVEITDLEHWAWFDRSLEARFGKRTAAGFHGVCSQPPSRLDRAQESGSWQPHKDSGQR